MIRNAFYISVALLLAAFAVFAGETGQPYSKVRYPTFKDGRPQTLLEAEQAEAFDITNGSPRVNMKNVRIILYETAPDVLASIPEGVEPPIKMTVTSDRGSFVRKSPETKAFLEEIVYLEDNVVLKRYATSSKGKVPANAARRRLDQGVETEVRCNHAQWNNMLRRLEGDGDVEFLQEDSRILGTGFLYLADELESSKKTDDPLDIKDWGGVIYIRNNAQMEIDGKLSGGASDQNRTIITCRDIASYKLDEREIQFERDVKLRRPGLQIESDILKVFLRQESDPLPENLSATETQPIPGQVKNIVATTDKRPGSVNISGMIIDDDGTPIGEYKARGGRADFDYDANRISLADTRVNRNPEVEFGPDRISDKIIEFDLIPQAGGRYSLKELRTSGGEGYTLIQSSPGPDGVAATEVTYTGKMWYWNHVSRVRYESNVDLKHGEMGIKSDLLDLVLGDQNPDGSRGIKMAMAEGNVRINTDGRETVSHRAEYEVAKIKKVAEMINLDTIRLFGTADRTPPHPWLKDREGNSISAPTVIIQRLQTSTERPLVKHLVKTRDGKASCEFVSTPASATARAKMVSIECEKGAEYNEIRKIASFEGHVVAMSSDPEDSYVLNSERLDVHLTEVLPTTGSAEGAKLRIRRIDAAGNARLMQDDRVCEAKQIIRDFPTLNPDDGDIYLEGEPGDASTPARPAVYWEGGKMDPVNKIVLDPATKFIAPRIKTSAKGNVIQANGPGQLSTLDDQPNPPPEEGKKLRAEINFAGVAKYEVVAGGTASEAKFRRGVVLRQPSRNLAVRAEALDTYFLKPEAAIDKPTPDVELSERVGRIRRAVAQVDVQVESKIKNEGRRVATADKGEIDFTDTGNVIVLTADPGQEKRRWVMVRDTDGTTLWAPRVEVRENEGVTRASGPGELQIPGNPGDAGYSKIPTKVAYGANGTLVYNELALNIKTSDNVRIRQPGTDGRWEQPNLDGRCDRMEISLIEPPRERVAGQDALSGILRIDAEGSVVMRMFAEPPPGQPSLDWSQRPGVTFFARGDKAIYDVPIGQIVMSSPNSQRRPQLLLHMMDSGSTPRRQRMAADRFILNPNTTPKRWHSEGELSSSTLRAGEAFEFME